MYQFSPATVNPTAPVEPNLPPRTPRHAVDAHAIPHLKVSKGARAVLGANILDGLVALQNPTRELVAKAVGVCPGYIDAARRLTPEQRILVEWGFRPLIPPRSASSASLPVMASPQERLANLVNKIGIDATLGLLAASETSVGAASVQTNGTAVHSTT